MRQRGYHHRIPDAAPSHALSGVHTPIVVIRESGLTIFELELEVNDLRRMLNLGSHFFLFCEQVLCSGCSVVLLYSMLPG